MKDTHWNKLANVNHNFAGKKLVEEGAQESVNVTVQTEAKTSTGRNTGPVVPAVNADASKVSVKGMGIKKAFLGKQNQFQVNASEAGNCQHNFA